MTLITLGFLMSIILADIYFIRPILRFISTMGLYEMYTALALLIVIGISVLMTLVRLLLALEAFLAGIVLTHSKFRHELKNDIEPFKGSLMEIFFINVGAEMNLPLLWQDSINILSLSILVIFVKDYMLYLLS